jgi:hypothetical protein
MNGTVANGHVDGEHEHVEDASTALSVLKKHYDEKDGISVQQLLDPKATGGLTYNDL